ncbi:Hypothetical protein PHPALM_3225 [Phytophthora palmivora]|uniref:Uncharacterized protein n=1 Tax=Phytophthora palmivora TaxID=4796 RepID=A0A2P4YMY1_9STRA|nr:Hypothetical protein PHPALM_3225 [Phytophthora palmivora]
MQVVEDCFGDILDLIDRWNVSKVPGFMVWSNDAVGNNLVGAETLGLRIFNALNRAAELASRPDIITQGAIDAFVAAER